MFESLRTLWDVEDFVAVAYSASFGRLSIGIGPSALTLAVAEPGPLMAHAIKLAGHDGLTRTQLRTVFHLLGKERFERGLSQLDVDDEVVVTKGERRPNRRGHLQPQTVFRAAEFTSRPGSS